jgi:hypothetical protein
MLKSSSRVPDPLLLVAAAAAAGITTANPKD